MLLCCVSVTTARRWRGAPTASTRGTLSTSKKGGTPRDAHGLLPSSLVGAAPLLLGFCLWRLRGLLLARCFDGRLRRLRHGLDLGRRLRVLLLRRLLAFGWRQRGFLLRGLGLGRHVRSPKGGRGARARGTRGRNFCRSLRLRSRRVVGLGRALLNLGARRYRGTVGVDAGACGLGGSRRTWFCWVSCAGNVGGDFWACAASLEAVGAARGGGAVGAARGLFFRCARGTRVRALVVSTGAAFAREAT